MLKIPVADETFFVVAPRWGELGIAAQIILLSLLLGLPLILVLWLSRYELRLIARGHAAGLLMLRVAVLFAIWLFVGFQPHLAGEHVDEKPSRVRIAVDLSSSMNIADDDKLTRKATVKHILVRDGLNLLDRLAERHEVEIVGFDQRAFPLTASQLFDALSAKPKGIQDTDVKFALASPAEPGKPPLMGVVLFSDGQHNLGAPPIALATELGKQRTPIYPVVLGSREPPSDLLVLDVQAPTKIFKDATLPVEARIKIANLPAQPVTVEMQFDGKPILPEHRETIEHKGRDDVYTVRFQTKMEAVGTHRYQIKAMSKEGKEITLANNIASRVVRVMQDKAKILLVDGEARWEYHYLATALARDPTIELDRVVFTQPRIGAIKEPELDMLGFAKTKLPEAKERDPLLDYDCILLGDVAPDDLPIADRKRIERYVSERGGTLVLIAGKRNLPLEYLKLADDPLVKLLPIIEPTPLTKDDGFTLRVTNEGKLYPFLQLEPDRPNASWPELPKHFWGIAGKRKPGATVLLAPVSSEMPKDEDRGILLEQNYGFGRVYFLGIDSTWRWRFRVGDTYHHRFWGQLLRAAAADKLLPAGNRFVRFGPREPIYSDGDEVELAIRLGATVPPLKDAKEVKAKLYHIDADGVEELVAVVPLNPHGRSPSLFEAKVPGLKPGVYRMAPEIPSLRAQLAEPSEDKDAPKKDLDRFEILPRPQMELLDLSTNWTLMQSLAQNSDGRLYTPANVEELLDRLARRIERKESRTESKPWRDAPAVWWMLGLLLGLLCVEWSWRKWLELP